jgi:hypothetical protein
MRLAGNVEARGEMRYAYAVVVRNSEMKRSLGRHRRKWEDNIKTDLTNRV